MRSAIFVKAGLPLAIEERPVPRPGPGQVLIRVHRCGICASDLSMTSGSPFDMPCGTAPGHEYSGEVVEVAAGSRLKPGDRISALPMATCGTCPACRAGALLHCPAFRSMAGGYSEYALVAESSAFRLPEGLSFADGALVEPLAAARRGVTKVEVGPESRIVVFGAGAIGAGAIYWLRQRRAGRIVVVARSTAGAELVTRMGADALLTSGDGLAERVAEQLGGPADLAVDGAGATGILQQAIDCVGWDGTVLSLGGCGQPDPILPILAMIKEVTMRFSVAYGTADFRATIDALDAGNVAPRALVAETIGLGALPARFEALRTGSRPAKVMVAPHEP